MLISFSKLVFSYTTLSVDSNEGGEAFNRLNENLNQGEEFSYPDFLKPVIDRLKNELGTKIVRIDHLYDKYVDVSYNKNQEIICKWEKLDIYVKNIIDMGAKPLMCLSYMPWRLREDHSAGIGSWPKNYKDWQKLVKMTVLRYNKEKNYNIEYWEVWNEPENKSFNFWKGRAQVGESLNKLIKLYEFSVKGIEDAEKEGDFKVKIGGFGLAGCTTHIMERLVKEGLRVDFISWHHYGNLSGGNFDLEKLREEIVKVKNIVGNGKELVISEWNASVTNTLYGRMVNRSHIGAAYAAAAISTMINNKISLACFSQIRENYSASIWSLGMFYPDSKYIKPVFNVFKMYHMLEPYKINLENSSNSYITGGIATKSTDGSRIKIIIWHRGEEKELINLNIKNINFNKIVVTRYLIDEENSNGKYYKIDALPTVLNENQELRTVDGYVVYNKGDMKFNKGTYNTSFYLNPHSVILFEVKNKTTGIDVFPREVNGTEDKSYITISDESTACYPKATCNLADNTNVPTYTYVVEIAFNKEVYWKDTKEPKLIIYKGGENAENILATFKLKKWKDALSSLTVNNWQCSYNVSEKKIKINPPNGSLEENTKYYIKLADGNIDWLSINFKTTSKSSNGSGLKIIKRYPEGSNIDPSTEIYAIFNTDLKESTINNKSIILKLGNSNIDGGYEYISSEKKLKFNPSNTLMTNNAFVITISDDLRNTNGRSLTYGNGGLYREWSFSTKARSNSYGKTILDRDREWKLSIINKADLKETGKNCYIEISLNENISGESNITVFTVQKDGQDIKRDTSYNLYDGGKILFYPIERLAYNIDYKVVLIIKDDQGNIISKNWTFNIQNSNLTGIIHYPNKEEEDVSITCDIGTRFGFDLNEESKNIANFILTLNNNEIPRTLKYYLGSKEMFIIPEKKLEYGKKYKVIIKGNIKGISGETLGNDYSWTFTTKSVPELVITDKKTSKELHNIKGIKVQYDELLDKAIERIEIFSDINYKSILRSTACKFNISSVNYDPNSMNLTVTLPYSREVESSISYFQSKNSCQNLKIFYLEEEKETFCLVMGRQITDKDKRVVKALYPLEAYSYYIILENKALDALASISVYPNPFYPLKNNKATFINLPGKENTTIKLYTINGEIVRILDKPDEVFSTRAVWDGKNEYGNLVASGVYIYVIDLRDGRTEVGKIAVIK